jgi:hypothetical protein
VTKSKKALIKVAHIHANRGIPVNSLTAIGGHDRQFFDKFLWGLVTSTSFVRC